MKKEAKTEIKIWIVASGTFIVGFIFGYLFNPCV